MVRRTRFGIRCVDLNLRVNGLAGDPVEDPSRLMGRVVTDRLMGVRLGRCGRMMDDFSRPMSMRFHPYHRCQNCIRRQQNPRLQSIEFKPVFWLSNYWIQRANAACFPKLLFLSQ
jgi:hypothetical protein